MKNPHVSPAHRVDLINAFCDYSHIAVWQFDKNHDLTDRYPGTPASEDCQFLLPYMKRLAEQKHDGEFEIIGYENELYGYIAVDAGETPHYFVCGPALLSHCYSYMEMRALSFGNQLPAAQLKTVTERLPVVTRGEFLSAMRLLLLMLGKKAPAKDAGIAPADPAEDQTIRSGLLKELFENQEESKEHTPFFHEQALLECVRSGDVNRLEQLYRSLPKTKYGRMSAQPLKSFFYGSIANTTLITRYAIMGGLDEETAFSLSDLYVRKMEQCRSVRELDAINEKMGVDFTGRVAETQNKNKCYSQPVARCISYINHNTHRKIDLNTVAEALDITPKYLSYLFKKETGQLFQHYVMEQKVAEAKALLTFSRYSCSDISEYLGFCSQSHFISVFKKYTGTTPVAYKKKQS